MSGDCNFPNYKLFLYTTFFKYVEKVLLCFIICFVSEDSNIKKKERKIYEISVLLRWLADPYLGQR